MAFNNNFKDSLFNESGEYIYKNIELSPNVFAHLLVYLFDGKQFKRSESIDSVVKLHVDSGGIARKKEYVSVFKHATGRSALKDSLANIGYGVWQLKYVETEITEVVNITDVKDVHIDADECIGEGEGTVYVYYYDIYKQFAESKGEKMWPCKVGMTDVSAMGRIMSQAGTAYPEFPHIALIIKCDDPNKIETAIHSILKVRKQWLDEAPGQEWFMTSPEDVKSIYEYICGSNI